MKNYKELSHDQKKEFWSNHIRLFSQSGLSQKKYCEQENLSYWSFRTWYYKTSPEAAETKFIRVNSFKTEEKSVSKIRIILSGKIRIEFDENISEEILRRIFKASEVLND
jgi:hypothetical protein